MKNKELVKSIYFLVLVFTITCQASFIQGQSGISDTYTSGSIETNLNSYDPGCNDPVPFLGVLLPSGFGDIEIFGIDIEYNMTASSSGWMADQRSQVVCLNTSNTEPVYSGVGNTQGTYSYERNGVSIANGTYASGTYLSFEMHAWRTFGGTGCDTTLNKVDNGSWTITIHACPTGNVHLNSQDKMDEFGSLFSCNSIQGSLIISGNDVMDCSGLSGVDSIQSGLEIINTTNITNLAGMNNLVFVNYNINIDNNEALTDISALSGISSPLTFLEIRNNDVLHNLNGLGNITNANSVRVINNLLLTSISGLNGLTESNYITIMDNPVLISLVGLHNITSITGLTIDRNNTITDLNGLQGLNESSSYIQIINNAELESLEGIENLITVGNLGMIISGNSMLTSLDGFMVRNTYSIVINNNWNLTDITALQSLDIATAGIYIENNSTLDYCCILNALYPRTTKIIPELSNNGEFCDFFSQVLHSCYDYDKDFDGVLDSIDNCLDYYNHHQNDIDEDGVGDGCDNCPLVSNPNQLDLNGNFIGDVCESPEPGQVGINTNDPNAGVEILASDLFLNDTQRGLIMRNVMGDCFRVFIDIEGHLKTNIIDCPD